MTSGVSGGMRCPPGRRIVRIHHHSHPPISDRPTKISFRLIYRNEFLFTECFGVQKRMAYGGVNR